jgi:hypothetical protein
LIGIYKAFDRFFRVGLDCFAMLAMTHGARSYLLTVKGLNSRNFGLLFDIDFSETALNNYRINAELRVFIQAPRKDVPRDDAQL